eukprot:symbB.v1.2.022330.t1/scaffold1974.1/size94090/6
MGTGAAPSRKASTTAATKTVTKVASPKDHRRSKKVTDEAALASIKAAKKRAVTEAKLAKAGAPGVVAPRPLPLSLLTKHKGVAWQWMEGGRMKYPIPIGCSRPLSPFSSGDD